MKYTRENWRELFTSKLLAKLATIRRRYERVRAEHVKAGRLLDAERCRLQVEKIDDVRSEVIDASSSAVEFASSTAGFREPFPVLLASRMEVRIGAHKRRLLQNDVSELDRISLSGGVVATQDALAVLHHLLDSRGLLESMGVCHVARDRTRFASGSFLSIQSEPLGNWIKRPDPRGYVVRVRCEKNRHVRYLSHAKRLAVQHGASGRFVRRMIVDNRRQQRIEYVDVVDVNESNPI